MAGSPQIVPRSSGSANEAIKRARAALREGRHASRSSTTRPARTRTAAGASAAIVRGIELYHVRGNHWNDIGYNFLVDRYGQVFEGRAGGIDRNVIGAQAQGFNTGSVGVALIGNYNTGNVTAAEQKALVSLLAWRLDVAHVDPLGTVDWVSGGNPKYPRRGRRSRCGRSPATAIRASRRARGRGSTRSCPRSPRTWRRPGCRSSTPPW